MQFLSVNPCLYTCIMQGQWKVPQPSLLRKCNDWNMTKTHTCCPIPVPHPRSSSTPPPPPLPQKTPQLLNFRNSFSLKNCMFPLESFDWPFSPPHPPASNHSAQAAAMVFVLERITPHIRLQYSWALYHKRDSKIYMFSNIISYFC